MVAWNPWLESAVTFSRRCGMVQRKLGRGLDFLISGTGDPSRDEIVQVDLTSIAPNPFQPRREFPEAELAELAASIREHDEQGRSDTLRGAQRGRLHRER